MALAQQAVANNDLDMLSTLFDDWTVEAPIYLQLPEAFIRLHKNRLNWRAISHHQKLSVDFIFEFRKRLDMKWVIKDPDTHTDVHSRIEDRKTMNMFSLLAAAGWSVTVFQVVRSFL